MLTTQTFLKKTRRGNVIKVVREHYLRDDIYCGSSACKDCNHIIQSDDDIIPTESSRASDELRPLAILSCHPNENASSKFSSHYLMIDTNIVLEEIDLLEDATGVQNVIILQTVLKEVRHRSTAIYKRLKDVISYNKRRFYVFLNEHHKDCYVQRMPGESANDRNDRAIRTACAWYVRHLKKHNIDTILLSNDADNRRLSAEMSLKCMSARNYIENLKEPALLIDKLSSNSVDEKSENKFGKELYAPHRPAEQINSGIKTGKVLQGVFYLSRTNFKEGTVSCEAYDQPVLIKGLENQNRAVNGDTVAIELLDKKEWSSPSDIILEDDPSKVDSGDTLDDAMDVEQSILENRSQSIAKSKLQPTGKVVGIINRKWRQYCGILIPNPVKGSTKHIFVAADRSIPKVRIETRQSDQLKSKKIVVALDSWPRHSRYPLGHYVRTVGQIGDKRTEIEVVLLEHDIPHSQFSQEVLDCLPVVTPEHPWTITEADYAKREDFRDLLVCSVDPPGCTDIDDALHSRILENGNWEFGVHIADVSHFLRPNNAMDKEAAHRCTSVYLSDRRIDMLPTLLSGNLCSLRGGVERFAFSCVWEVDPNTAEFLSTRFCKSVIKSKKAMTYEEAQNRIDDTNDNSDLTLSLRRIMKISKILKENRRKLGALQLAGSEVRFTVDRETADPIDVQTKKSFETNSMVEEWMLAANCATAKFTFEQFPECAVLRRHPEPPPSNFDPLILAGKQVGHEIKVGNAKELQVSLDAAVSPDNPYFNTMLRMIATRCMMQAVYFATGTIEEPLFVHYGLAAAYYTHFTSPIRRYADVMVHRLLAAAIGADVTWPDLLDKKRAQTQANMINYRHRMAQYAERSSVNLFTHMFFKNTPRDEQGYILFIKQNAIQVLIPKYGLEGTLYLNPNDKVKFEYDASIPSQSVKSQDVTLTLFMLITVRLMLDDSNIQHEKLVLKLVEPTVEGFSVDKLTESIKISEPPKKKHKSK